MSRDPKDPPRDPELKPMTGAQLALRPSAPPRPATGTQPAFQPTTGKTGTQRFAAFKPVPSGDKGVVKSQKPNQAPTSSVEDTFVKTKMKQAESKVPDFDLDEDLG